VTHAGLPGKHQIINASLAVALCRSVFSSEALPSSLSRLSEPAGPVGQVPNDYLPYLERTRWPGRCQTVEDPASTAAHQTTWYLDGAHTVESLTCCGDWAFSTDGMLATRELGGEEEKRVLIFNCTSGRSARGLLAALLDAAKKGLQAQGQTNDGDDAILKWFDKVVFCTNVTYTDGGFKGGESSKRALDKGTLRC
jgi:folylpolyglutamate synthase